MIYNIMRYLEIFLPNENIYANVFNKRFPNEVIPDRIVSVMEQGGEQTPITKYKISRFQILVRDKNIVSCRELAYIIYNKLHDRYGVILPSITVNGIVYEAIQTAEIKFNNIPQSIGYDEESRAIFSMNFIIITGG